MSWYERAACKGMDTAYHFHRMSGAPTEEAERACAGCPVRDECRVATDAAESTLPLDHILSYCAGMTCHERRKRQSLSRKGAAA